MPLYEYHCDNCDTDHEIFHGMKDEPKTECPNCNVDALVRKISLPCLVVQTCRTVGALAEENTKRALKQGKIPPGHEPKAPKPWWRSSDKINPDILKNPQKYIQTGET